jgi:hypothetical protein
VKFLPLLVFLFLYLVSAQRLCADTKTFDADSPEAQENLAMIAEYHLAKQPVPLAYESVAVQMMLREANHMAETLKLPTSRPIQLSEIRYPYVSPPWYSMLKETSRPFWPITIFSNRIFDTNIPRDERARAFKMCLRGTIETLNFLFAFNQGRISDIERLSGHNVQYYSMDIEKLIGKSSLINNAEAHKMATQWLAAAGVNVTALEKKYPYEVNRLRVLPRNYTNVVEVPIYFVHWGWRYFRNGDATNSESLVEVKILGTTKELVELRLSDTSFSERPPLLITNAIDLLRMGNPPEKHLNVNTNEARQNLDAPHSP